MPLTVGLPDAKYMLFVSGYCQMEYNVSPTTSPDPFQVSMSQNNYKFILHNFLSKISNCVCEQTTG